MSNCLYGAADSAGIWVDLVHLVSFYLIGNGSYDAFAMFEANSGSNFLRRGSNRVVD